MHQRTGHFIHRSIAIHGNDSITPIGHGSPGQFRGMSASFGELERTIVPGLPGIAFDRAKKRWLSTDAPGLRVDDETALHRALTRLLEDIAVNRYAEIAGLEGEIS